MDLSNATHAFVTGGASGIGLAVAQALARRGLRVTLADVDREGLEAAVADGDGRLRAAVLDTRDRAGWADAKAQAEAAFGPVDVLVNNAGIAPDGREFADMDPTSFDRILAINLVGVFNGVSAFAADMRARRRGHIANMASLAGLAPPFPGGGAYAVSKFGVVALSEGLRVEMAPHGVGVSVICPGLVASNLGPNTAKLGGQVRNPDAAMPPGAMDAAHAGEIIVRGVERNDLYILTHPERWDSVEARLNAIRDAFLAAASPPRA